MFHSALLHALQWLRPKVLAKFASTKLAQRQSHIRRSIKAVNYDKVFSFIEPFSFLTVKKNFEMYSEDEQHKSSLAAHYFATQEYQNKSSAGVRPIFDDFYPKCSNLQLNFNNPFILLFQTCA